MQPHSLVALTSLAALMVYFWMGLRVGRQRGRSGIAPPAMTGDPALERTIRVHLNTLEWLPLFLVPLWLFAFYWSDWIAAALGWVWIIGRVLYALTYVADPAKRTSGFLIQFLAVAVLTLGALAGIARTLVLTGA